jgi:hypothetical protein
MEWAFLFGSNFRYDRLAMLERNHLFAGYSLSPQDVLKYRITVVTELLGILFSQ